MGYIHRVMLNWMRVTLIKINEKKHYFRTDKKIKEKKEEMEKSSTFGL